MSGPTMIILFVITWFLVMFVVLPIRLRTQGEEGDIVEGTHAGAPADFRLGRTMLIVTLITLVVWGLEIWAVRAGLVTERGIEWQRILGRQ